MVLFGYLSIKSRNWDKTSAGEIINSSLSSILASWVLFNISLLCANSLISVLTSYLPLIIFFLEVINADATPTHVWVTKIHSLLLDFDEDTNGLTLLHFFKADCDDLSFNLMCHFVYKELRFVYLRLLNSFLIP